MRLRLLNQKIRAFTLPELLVMMAILALMAFIIYPGETSGKKRAQRINCLSNVHQVSLAFRIWQGDNNGKYPMSVSMTNGGAMEWTVTTNVAAYFQVMSNEIVTPKILICPADMEHKYPRHEFPKRF